MKIWSWPRDRAAVEANFEQAGAASREVEQAVDRIIAEVRKDGDAAVARLTKKFDGAALKPAEFEVGAERLAQAWAAQPVSLRRALRNAKRRIEAFHKTQKLKGWVVRESGFGRIEQRVMPLDRVAVYVPNGVAPLVSTVLMDVIPAKIAGVGEIVLVSPPNADGEANEAIMAAAHLVGVDRFFRIGGTPSMPALAYGTETIPRVDKVVGPGNIYVATAKQKLYGRFDIDSIAGPSEVLVLADESAPLEFIAADLLAQAEHDGNNPCGVVLIGGGVKRARALAAEVERRLARLSRAELAGRSIREQGYIICVRTDAEAVELANRKAPEHLEIMTENARELSAGVRHAGAIFLGRWSPEPLGDYMAGPNHTLPTGGTARFFSPLSVWSFYKTSHVIEATEKGLKALADQIVELAEAEGLTAHAESIRVRMKKG